MTHPTNAKFEATIQPWGNSLGLRITRPICDLAHLGRGDKVIVEVTENGLTVRPKSGRKHLGLPYSEDDLVQGLTPHKAHADELPYTLPSEAGE
jgi:antitoxin MazE